jgi:hypothetical protein
MLNKFKRELLIFLTSFLAWYFIMSLVAGTFNTAEWTWYWRTLYLLFGVFTTNASIYKTNN